MENDNKQTIVVIHRNERSGNGLGTAGFVLSLIGLLICWIPLIGQILGGILLFLGFLFSFIGVFRSPRGLAIAGLILSLIAVFVIVSIVGAMASL